jgi:hypothetical protein
VLPPVGHVAAHGQAADERALLVVERHGLHAVGHEAVRRVEVEGLRLAGERGLEVGRHPRVVLGRQRLRQVPALVGGGVEAAPRELAALGDDDPQIGVEERHDRVGEVGDQRAVARVRERPLGDRLVARRDVLAREVDELLPGREDRAEHDPAVPAVAGADADLDLRPLPRAAGQRALGAAGALPVLRVDELQVRHALELGDLPSELALPRRVRPDEPAVAVRRAHQVVGEVEQARGAGARRARRAVSWLVPAGHRHSER